MKFLPESKKKRIWSIAILIVSLSGIVYFNFFTGPAGIKSGNLEVLKPLKAPQGVPQAAPPPTKATSKLLPYGSEIDLTILNREEFRVLKAAPPFSVLPQELGKENPFE